MSHPEHDDRRLREMFTRSRLVDRARAPEFDDLLDSREGGAVHLARPSAWRRWWPILASGAAASLLTALALTAFDRSPQRTPEADPMPQVARSIDPIGGDDSIATGRTGLSAQQAAGIEEVDRAPAADDAKLPVITADPDSGEHASQVPEASQLPDALPAPSAELDVVVETGAVFVEPRPTRGPPPARVAPPPPPGKPVLPQVEPAAVPQGYVSEFHESPVTRETAASQLNALGYASSSSPSPGDYRGKGAPAATDAATRYRTLLEKERELNTESYSRIVENSFRPVAVQPLSTFALDVDTASYSNVRRYLEGGALPPKDAVRIEELINYFAYDYPEPTGRDPFSVDVEVAGCPWKPEHRLVRIGLRGRQAARHEESGRNLVFLIDVSGSMSAKNKLPLLKETLGLLVDRLEDNDRIAIVTYAEQALVLLPATPGYAHDEILQALRWLEADGGTNGGAGLRIAYEIAGANFVPGGVNRVILATDGDFNVGVTGKSDLLEMIRDDAEDGIFLTVLGFGDGDYQGDRLELLADRANGNYAYIDSAREAKRVLVEQGGGTLVAIARDVKAQVEFNPARVRAYRLIGYENRGLKAEQFNDDSQDGGEIGAGHTVTALYEIVPSGTELSIPGVDPLKYQAPVEPNVRKDNGELLTVKLRYKEPEGGPSRLIEVPVVDSGATLHAASADFKLAAAAAAYGMLLRESPYLGETAPESLMRLAYEGIDIDRGGYRQELHTLFFRALQLYRAQHDPRE